MCDMRVEDWRKAKTSEAKTDSIIFILQGKDKVLQEFFPMKRS